MNTRVVLPENPQMNRQDFYRLCHKLKDCEYQLAHLEKPDRGTKAKAKKTRQELRIILTPRQLAQLTTKARQYNTCEYTLYVEDYVDEDFGEQWFKKQREKLRAEWGALLPSLYHSTFPLPDA